MTVLAVGVIAGALAVSGRGDVVAAPTTAAAATQPAPSSAAPAAPAPTPTLPATSAGSAWGSVLAEIDRGRTAALAAGSPQQLRAWVTGTAYAADLALARTVAAAGARIEGGGLVLEEVRAVDVDATTAVLDGARPACRLRRGGRGQPAGGSRARGADLDGHAGARRVADAVAHRRGRRIATLRPRRSSMIAAIVGWRNS